MNKPAQVAPRDGLNTLLVIFVIVLNLWILFFAPLLLAQQPLWLLSAVLVDAILLRVTNLHWHLLHEAAHGMLLSKRFWNERLGQLMGWTFLSGFAVLRMDHLIHHRANRIDDLPDIYFKPNKPPRLAYYADILGGFYVVYEILLPLLSFVPRRWMLKILAYWHAQTERHIIYDQLLRLANNPKALRQMRVETVIMLAVIVASVWCYQQHLWLWGLHVYLRALFVSYLNNMPHYGNAVNDVYASDTAYLPKWLARCYLNFNYHKTHHLHPRLPWHALPQAFAASDLEYDANYLKNYFDQLRGPIARVVVDAQLLQQCEGRDVLTSCSN